MAMKDNGKKVYWTVGFNADSKWNDVFDDMDGQISSLQSYINNVGIAGAVFNTLNIYVSGDYFLSVYIQSLVH